MSNYYTIELPIPEDVKIDCLVDTGVEIKENAIKLVIEYEEDYESKEEYLPSPTYKYITFNGWPIIYNNYITLYNSKVTPESLDTLKSIIGDKSNVKKQTSREEKE